MPPGMESDHVGRSAKLVVHVEQAKWPQMAREESLPSVDTIADNLGELFSSRTARVTKRLARKIRVTLALYVLGGPEPPETEDEAAERIDKLWALLREFLEWNFADAISTDPIVDTQPATPEEWGEAACLICRFDERGETWHCDDYSENFPDHQVEADRKIRKSVGSDTYFRKNFQEPVFEALARLLLKAEIEHRAEVGITPPKATTEKPPHRGPDEDEEDDSGKDPLPPKLRPSTRRLLVGAASILVLAALVFAIASGGASKESVLALSDLSVSLQAGLEDGSKAAALSGSKVDLGTTGGVQEVGFQAVVRPVRGQRGRIPSGLRLVVVISRKSLASDSLPSAFLQAAGSAVREVGQQASDSVTIASRLPAPLGLDIPSGFRIQVKPGGSTRWEPPQLLSSRWLTCSEQRCELRLPLARFTGDTGEAVRVGFQTLAFGLTKDAPLLVMDMEQRRLGDRLARDGELHVSPGDRVLYSLYLANRGTESARNVVARLALPTEARLIPGSVRATTTGASTPFAVEDNLANGGVRYAEFGPGASASFTAIAEVRPALSTVGEMYPYWLVKSDETHGTSYYDSVAASTGS